MLLHRQARAHVGEFAVTGEGAGHRFKPIKGKGLGGKRMTHTQRKAEGSGYGQTGFQQRTTLHGVTPWFNYWQEWQ
ncbi:hypothetical protein D3C87_1445370 [compost metagenome]